MTTHEWTDGPPTAAVLHAVATEEGREPEELPELYGAVDPDALNALFDSTATDTTTELRVDFSYGGYDVTVTDGSVELEPAEDAGRRTDGNE